MYTKSVFTNQDPNSVAEIQVHSTGSELATGTAVRVPNGCAGVMVLNRGTTHFFDAPGEYPIGGTGIHVLEPKFASRFRTGGEPPCEVRLIFVNGKAFHTMGAVQIEVQERLHGLLIPVTIDVGLDYRIIEPCQFIERCIGSDREFDQKAHETFVRELTVSAATAAISGLLTGHQISEFYQLVRTSGSEVKSELQKDFAEYGLIVAGNYTAKVTAVDAAEFNRYHQMLTLLGEQGIPDRTKSILAMQFLGEGKLPVNPMVNPLMFGGGFSGAPTDPGETLLG